MALDLVGAPRRDDGLLAAELDGVAMPPLSAKARAADRHQRTALAGGRLKLADLRLQIAGH